MRPSTVSTPTIQGVMVGIVPSNQVSAASMNAQINQRIPSIMPSFAAVAATPQDSYAAAAAKLAVPRGGSGLATITSAAMLAGPRGQFIPGAMDKSRQQHTMQYVGSSLPGAVKMPLAELNKMTHDQKKSELVGNLDQLTRLLRILREQVVSDKAGISAKLQRTSRSDFANVFVRLKAFFFCGCIKNDCYGCREPSMFNSNGNSSSDNNPANGQAAKEDSPKPGMDALQQGEGVKDDAKEAHGHLEDKEFFSAVAEYWKEGQQGTHRNVLFEVWQVRFPNFLSWLCVIVWTRWGKKNCLRVLAVEYSFEREREITNASASGKLRCESSFSDLVALEAMYAIEDMFFFGRNFCILFSWQGIVYACTRACVAHFVCVCVYVCVCVCVCVHECVRV